MCGVEESETTTRRKGIPNSFTPISNLPERCVSRHSLPKQTARPAMLSILPLSPYLYNNPPARQSHLNSSSTQTRTRARYRKLSPLHRRLCCLLTSSTPFLEYGNPLAWQINRGLNDLAGINQIRTRDFRIRFLELRKRDVEFVGQAPESIFGFYSVDE